MEPTGRIAPLPWAERPGPGRLVALLARAGAPARFVGGCVRDAVLGRDSRDLDLATPAAPGEIQRICVAAGLRVEPTGLEHGTVTVIVDHEPFEVTTLRRDVETYGRHARVEFTDDWIADAARRDFTFNAMYCDPDGTLYDPFGGCADLIRGRVRFVGEPAARIAEDVLRLLRFFRFFAWYGAPPADAGALAAARAWAPRLADLSVERVRDELLKLLAARAPGPSWALMRRCGVLAAFLPEAAPARDRVLARLVEIEGWLGRADPVRRLGAVLGHADEALAVARRLRLPRADQERLGALFAGPPPTPGAAGPTRRRELWALGWQSWTDRRLVAAAQGAAEAEPVDLDALAGELRAAESWARPDFPLRGRDLIALGLAPGPEMGELLAAVERWWAERDFAPDRAACLARARELAGLGAVGRQ